MQNLEVSMNELLYYYIVINHLFSKGDSNLDEIKMPMKPSLKAMPAEGAIVL